MNGHNCKGWGLVILLGLVTTTGAGAKQAGSTPSMDQAKKSFELAVSLLRDGKYDNALKEFEKVAADFPNTSYAPDSLLQIAQYHFSGSGNLAKAQDAVSRLTKTYDDQRWEAAPEAHILAGRILLAGSRAQNIVQDALVEFQRVPRVYGSASGAANSVPAALYWQAETRRVTGDTDAALQAFRSISSDYPQSPWAARARLGAAQCLVAKGESIRAMEELQRVSASPRFAGSPQAQTATAWNTILYRIAVRGQVPYRFTSKTIPGGVGKLKDVRGMAFNSKDDLYVMRPEGVNVLSADGKMQRTVAAQEPSDVFFDASGRLVVVGKGRVVPEGANALAVSVPRSDNPLPRPIEDISSGAAWSTGEYLIAEKDGKAILKFSSAGKFLGTLTTLNVSADRFAVNALDELAVLNRDERTVTFFDRDGKIVRRIQPKGTNPAYELKKPVDIAFDRLGHLFVLDRTAVYIFGPNGRLVSVMAIAEKQPGALRDARVFALDSAGRLFIYDNKDEHIQIYQ